MDSLLPPAADAGAGSRFELRDVLLPILERCFESGGILGYHAIVEDGNPSPEMHISVEMLRLQLEYLRARYDVIPLWELARRQLAGRPIDHCVAITFDDAYVGVERLAAPLLARLDLPATVFVTVSAAESGAPFWWDGLEHARRTSPDCNWPRVLGRIGMPPLPSSAGALALAREHILTKHAGRLDAETAELPEPSNELLRSMSFEALSRMADDERFEFGCHTMSHPVLPFLTSGEQQIEMAQAQHRLLEMLPRVVPIIAYPYGLYDRTTLSEAARAGFRVGVTMQGRALAHSDLALALPRAGVSEDWSQSAIALRLNGGLRPLFKARAGTHPRLAAPRRDSGRAFGLDS